MPRRVLSDTYSARWARAKRARERDAQEHASSDAAAISSEPIGIAGSPHQRDDLPLFSAQPEYHCGTCLQPVAAGWSECTSCGSVLLWDGLL